MAFAGNSDSEDEDTKVNHHRRNHNWLLPRKIGHLSEIILGPISLSCQNVFSKKKSNSLVRKVARKKAREEQNREWRKKREMAR